MATFTFLSWPLTEFDIINDNHGKSRSYLGRIGLYPLGSFMYKTALRVQNPYTHEVHGTTITCTYSVHTCTYILVSQLCHIFPASEQKKAEENENANSHFSLLLPFARRKNTAGLRDYIHTCIIHSQLASPC